MKFKEAVSLLKAAKREHYILKGQNTARQVLVCPELAGRVMGTTCSGPTGVFGGFIDAKAFKDGITDIWDNWGGEERYWLCPEGGQYGLMFGGKKSCFENYTVQDGFNNQPFKTLEVSKLGNSITMRSRMVLKNGVGTIFHVEITRRITLLDACPYSLGQGDKVDFTGFQSESRLTNVGDKPMTRETGVLAHWHLGQFPVDEHIIAVIPYRPGHYSDPPVREDYFKDFVVGGAMPANRYRILPASVLFKADGKVRTKIGQNRSRAMGLLASYNLATDEIVLLDYDFYPNHEYAASYWYELADPYDGDCISFSAEGPDQEGGSRGRCYELEAMSPALFLHPGESFDWRTRTLHMTGPRVVMAGILRRNLSTEISSLEDFDKASHNC
jgi:hypothetical protein